MRRAPALINGPCGSLACVYADLPQEETELLSGHDAAEQGNRDAPFQRQSFIARLQRRSRGVATRKRRATCTALAQRELSGPPVCCQIQGGFCVTFGYVARRSSGRAICRLCLGESQSHCRAPTQMMCSQIQGKPACERAASTLKRANQLFRARVHDDLRLQLIKCLA